jgi:hypothetical protein
MINRPWRAILTAALEGSAIRLRIQPTVGALGPVSGQAAGFQSRKGARTLMRPVPREKARIVRSGRGDWLGSPALYPEPKLGALLVASPPRPLIPASQAGRAIGKSTLIERRYVRSPGSTFDQVKVTKP